MQDREEGYYWAVYDGTPIIIEIWGNGGWCVMTGTQATFEQCDFDEIGPKIEPPTPKHVCEFKRVKGLSGIEFDYCSCGISIPHLLASHEDRMTIRKELSTPGSVFQIVDESEA